MASITKRGERWYARIRKKGFPEETGSFLTKKKAEAWAADVETKMEQGLFVDRRAAQRTTLSTLFQDYREHVSPQHAGGEVEAYRLKAWERNSPLRQYSAAALSGADVAKWRDERLQQVSPDTVIAELGLLHRVIERARDEWGIHLSENPVSRVRRPPRGQGRERRLMPGEESRLLAACTADNQTVSGGGQGGKVHRPRNEWLGPALVLAIETAMRRSDLLRLRWEDISLSQRVATIQTSKNGRRRSVPLSTKALDALRQLGAEDADSGPVFPITANALKLAWERALKRARATYQLECERNGVTPSTHMLADLRWHDLRHEATSRLFERGFNVMEVASITGHKDLRMLERYTHMFAADLAKRID